MSTLSQRLAHTVFASDFTFSKDLPFDGNTFDIALIYAMTEWDL